MTDASGRGSADRLEQRARELSVVWLHNARVVSFDDALQLAREAADEARREVAEEIANEIERELGQVREEHTGRRAGYARAAELARRFTRPKPPPAPRSELDVCREALTDIRKIHGISIDADRIAKRALAYREPGNGNHDRG